MKHIIWIGILLAFIFSVGNCYSYPSVTFRGGNGYALAINSDGSINVKMDGTTETTSTYAYPPKTLRDTEGEEMQINSDGSLNIQGD